MKNWLLLLVGIAMGTSCSLEYETTIEKDGGGEKQFQVDISGLGGMAGLFDGAMGGEEMDEDVLDENMDENLNMDELEDVMEGEKPLNMKSILDNPMALGNIDTIFSLYEEMPDSLRLMPNADLLKKITIKIRNSDETQESNFRIGIKYDNQKEFDKILETADSFMSEADPEKETKFSKFFNDNAEIVDLKNGTVIIPEQDISDQLGDEDLGMGDLGLGGEGENEEDDEEMMAMMSMMFGEMGLSYIYHLPGPVEFTNDPKAIIEGNTVTFKLPLMELMKNNVTPKYVIKYKP